ncbi:MAG: hypothetical protein RTV41_11740 [Candidatus Thorarchaeota archaeon]
METVPASPPNPIMGIITTGFVLLAIYVFAKISSEGESRYTTCKKVTLLGILGMLVVATYESLNNWIWSLQYQPMPPLSVWIVSMGLASPFIVAMILDLVIQRALLKR